MVKIFYYIIIILLIILLSIITYIGISTSNSVMYKKRRNYDQIVDLQVKSGAWFIEDFNKLDKEEVIIDSPHGYKLKGFFIRASVDNNKTIIISHGVTVSLYSSIKYTLMFLNLGYDVLIYDHRYHGESGGEFISYGVYERYDLKAVVDYVKEMKGKDSLLGIHGESMGSGIALMYAGSIEDGANFYIIDCAYSDFQEEFRIRIKEDTKFHPFIIVPLTNLFLYIRGRFTLKDICPIRYIKNIKSPMLFITTKGDPYIPLSMTMDLYNAKSEPKSLFLAENGGHAQGFSSNQEEYKAVVEKFIKEVESNFIMKVL